jgi:gamma-glutamylcyclotransferase (GGCT)/AIG2-like uncharacterized protein YtfP
MMQDTKHVGRGIIDASLYALGWYPGIKFNAAGNTVVVDVHELPEERTAILGRLDGYEGYNEHIPEGSLFIRRQTLVALEDGREVLAYVYEYNHAVNPDTKVENGDWNAYNSVQTT